ncbi:HK97 family phage prohead protease [Sphingobium ummariense]|uniref:Prohead serine protease domain-containing protein n=1 Tax=Sphingobium ummariense RL-3 TaxID=1346791 RepID=T0IWW9_9SPHN|nr:HK97 family phage prohead protease [Sphingobium ummariense]EQB33310.1 hypothetical protein M529_04910 [Sphingobium ummariense RL-3]
MLRFAQQGASTGSARTEGEGDVRFAGYAAVFGRVDRGGDLVRAGAFGAVRAAGVPLLWQHLPDAVIGTVERLEEDARGLRVIGRVSARTAAGREAARALREKAVDGLSFGYRVREARGATPRELVALELVEVSLVTHPMQPLARVHAVESDA